MRCWHQRCLSTPLTPTNLPGTPGGPKPVETPSCRSAFDDAPRASVTALGEPPTYGRSGLEWIGDRSAFRLARPVVGRFGELSRATLVSALHPSTPAWELLRLSPSDFGQSPLTPSSPGPALSTQSEPRMISTSPASTRPASFIPGALHRRSAIEAPWPRFPAATRSIAAFATMNPRPPATSARLCRRALASAPSVPPGHNRLSPFAPSVAAIVRPMACTQSPSPWPEPKLVQLEERRSSTSARYFRSASTTVESSNPAGSGANAFKTLSGRAGMLSSCPIGSTALDCVVFRYALPSSLPAA